MCKTLGFWCEQAINSTLHHENKKIQVSLKKTGLKLALKLVKMHIFQSAKHIKHSSYEQRSYAI
jgi:hypothetical protein